MACWRSYWTSHIASHDWGEGGCRFCRLPREQYMLGGKHNDLLRTLEYGLDKLLYRFVRSSLLTIVLCNCICPESAKVYSPSGRSNKQSDGLALIFLFAEVVSVITHVGRFLRRHNELILTILNFQIKLFFLMRTKRGCWYGFQPVRQFLYTPKRWFGRSYPRNSKLISLS